MTNFLYFSLPRFSLFSRFFFFLSILAGRRGEDWKLYWPLISRRLAVSKTPLLTSMFRNFDNFLFGTNIKMGLYFSQCL